MESIEKQAQKQIEAKRKNLEKQKLEEEYSKKIEEAKRSQVEQVKREMTKDTNNASSSKNFENKIANGPKPKVFSHTSEINIVKKEAQTLQKVEKSYLDEKTQLKEEEVAKTTLIDEDFDLSDLFVEKDDS